MMFSGVIAFSFSAGALTNFISEIDAKGSNIDEKIAVLDKLQDEYKLPVELYSQIKKNIRSNYMQDT